MKIIGAKWEFQVNMLEIQCGCSMIFLHRADRWKVKCPICKRESHLALIRNNYMEEFDATKYLIDNS